MCMSGDSISPTSERGTVPRRPGWSARPQCAKQETEVRIPIYIYIYITYLDNYACIPMYIYVSTSKGDTYHVAQVGVYGHNALLAFTRYSFTSRLLCTNLTSLGPTRPTASATLLQCCFASVEQYSTLSRPPFYMLFNIQDW